LSDETKEGSISPMRGEQERQRRMWEQSAYTSIIDAYRNHEDPNLVAQRLGMPACTARTIINKFRKNPEYNGPKKRGGPFRVLYDRYYVVQELSQWLAVASEHYPPLREMITHLESVQKKAPSKSTLATWLDHDFVLSSKSRNQSVGVSVDDVLNDRAQFAEWVLAAKDSTPIVYIGIHVINVWSKRLRLSNLRSSVPSIAINQIDNGIAASLL
jgi:hypothetical protein